MSIIYYNRFLILNYVKFKIYKIVFSNFTNKPIKTHFYCMDINVLYLDYLNLIFWKVLIIHIFLILYVLFVVHVIYE